VELRAHLVEGTVPLPGPILQSAAGR
jgi:hypothetical protein